MTSSNFHHSVATHIDNAIARISELRDEYMVSRRRGQEARYYLYDGKFSTYVPVMKDDKAIDARGETLSENLPSYSKEEGQALAESINNALVDPHVAVAHDSVGIIEVGYFLNSVLHRLDNAGDIVNLL